MHETLPEIALQQSPLLSECAPPRATSEAVTERDRKEQADCQQQLDLAFSKFFSPPSDGSRNDVLVCHGNVIRYFVMKALGVETKAWSKLSVGHTSLTVIRIRHDGRITVLTIGDVGHLPPNLQSGNGDHDPELTVPKMAAS
jgi:serine/threonine-protein phosphatase PGAM5